jgi:hypothetical protein
MTVRIYTSLPIRAWKTLADAGIVAPFGNSYLRIGNLKAFADGSLGSETTWMDEPFSSNRQRAVSQVLILLTPTVSINRCAWPIRPVCKLQPTPSAIAPAAPCSIFAGIL